MSCETIVAPLNVVIAGLFRLALENEKIDLVEDLEY